MTSLTGGAAVERTALAWSRSALAFVAIAGSVLKAALEADAAVLGIAAAGVLLVVAGVVWTTGTRYAARRGHGAVPSHAARRRQFWLLSGAAVFSAATAFVIALLT